MSSDLDSLLMLSLDEGIGLSLYATTSGIRISHVCYGKWHYSFGLIDEL